MLFAVDATPNEGGKNKILKLKLLEWKIARNLSWCRCNATNTRSINLLFFATISIFGLSDSTLEWIISRNIEIKNHSGKILIEVQALINWYLDIKNEWCFTLLENYNETTRATKRNVKIMIHSIAIQNLCFSFWLVIISLTKEEQNQKSIILNVNYIIGSFSYYFVGLLGMKIWAIS